MTTIVPTLMTGSGQRTLVPTTMTASNTFVYKPGTGQILMLRNATAGALTPILDGVGGTTVPVAGIGNVSVAAGFNAAPLLPPQPLQSRSTRLARSCRALST